MHERTARRDALLDKLERAEQQLASCERSLQALSIEDAPREEAPALPEAATSRPEPLAQPQAAAAPTRIHDPAVPGGVTDLVHDHRRQIGRGFSNDPDQTARPTPLTQSNFSLQFVQGRVVVTHIYPCVPHRQLTTA